MLLFIRYVAMRKLKLERVGIHDKKRIPREERSNLHNVPRPISLRYLGLDLGLEGGEYRASVEGFHFDFTYMCKPQIPIRVGRSLYQRITDLKEETPPVYVVEAKVDLPQGLTDSNFKRGNEKSIDELVKFIEEFTSKLGERLGKLPSFQREPDYPLLEKRLDAAGRSEVVVE